MSRLIDADALLKRWKYGFDHRKSLEECIKTQPTAYDVEKVVAELDDKAYTTTDTVCGGIFEAIRLSSAIDIVKRGGVE